MYTVSFHFVESQPFLEIKLCTIPPKAPTVNGHLEVTEIASLRVGDL